MKREILLLVGSALAVDLLFILGFFAFHLDAASSGAKIGYTAAWTVVTLLVVLRGLARIRARRGRGGGAHAQGKPV